MADRLTATSGLCQSRCVKSCGPSGSQDLAFLGQASYRSLWLEPGPARLDAGSGAQHACRGSERPSGRGPPGVYEAVIPGHRESPPVQRIRRNEAPEVTGGDSSRPLSITRNEGVPGSSPGVGLKVPAQKPPVFSIWETHEVLQTDLRFRAMAFCFSRLIGRSAVALGRRTSAASKRSASGTITRQSAPAEQGQSVRPSVQEPDGEQ